MGAQCIMQVGRLIISGQAAPLHWQRRGSCLTGIVYRGRRRLLPYLFKASSSLLWVARSASYRHNSHV